MWLAIQLALLPIFGGALIYAIKTAVQMGKQEQWRNDCDRRVSAIEGLVTRLDVEVSTDISAIRHTIEEMSKDLHIMIGRSRGG